MLKKMRIGGLALVFMLSLVLSACGSSDNGGSGDATSGNGGNEGGDNATEESSGGGLGDKKITIPYVSWAGAVASTYTVSALLESVGYEVTPKQVSAGAMWSSTASGSADAFTAAWLPLTHKDYWNKYKDSLAKLQKTIKKAPLGLTVPSYVKIDSIADMKGNKKLGEATEWTITGIDPGAGEMDATRKGKKKYGLEKWNLQASSGPAMTAALSKAIEAHKPIIVTLWKPHWAFAEWDLKILKDPKKIYGTADSIYTVANKDLEKQSPAAYKILSQFNWDYDAMHVVMSNIHGGMKPEKAGKQFIKKHPDMVKEWTKGVAAAK
ncbi:MAG TPA: glycine betaine ABC transporter substrate-binding protein [Bacillales bacterium]|nr:glycine betaine ABC transporter substrate-binding protein [Bacillales bacterium]